MHNISIWVKYCVGWLICRRTMCSQSAKLVAICEQYERILEYLRIIEHLKTFTRFDLLEALGAP